LTAAGLKVDVALAKPKKEAIPIARQAVKDGYDVIIAMGGDGTLGAVIRGIAGSKARLVLSLPELQMILPGVWGSLKI